MKQLAVPSFTVFREPRHDRAVRAARAPDNRSRQHPGRRRKSDNTDRHRWTERLPRFKLILVKSNSSHFVKSPNHKRQELGF